MSWIERLEEMFGADALNPPAWKGTPRKVIHDDLIRIEEHRIETEDGRNFITPLSTYPDSVGICARTSEGEIAVVCQHRYGLGQRTIEVPGGVVEAGSGLLETAHEELSEEGGLKAGSMKQMISLPASPGFHQPTHLFFADMCSPVRVEPDPDCRALLIPQEMALEIAHSGEMPLPSAFCILLAAERF